MQEDLLEDFTFKKIYTVKTIIICSFFGGLLASGYMLYKNFKAFGDNKKANLVIIATLTILLGLIGISLIPAFEKIPDIVYSILITLLTVFITKYYQEDLISDHVDKRGNFYTIGNAVLVCIVSALVIVVPIFLLYLVEDSIV